MRSGIATDNAELLPLLDGAFAIDRYDEPHAHDYVWKARRQAYDLTVYQLGNAPCHDYIWAYLARYPGLVVVHDPRLHHARARLLLNEERFDDYRREFRYDHPDAPAGFAEYAIAGLGGAIYYFWSMLRLVLRTARLVAVTNPRVAADLREEFPGVPIETIRLGKSPLETTDAMRRSARQRLGIGDRTVVFAAFGKLTPEKRIEPIVNAFGSLVRDGALGDARLLLAGDAHGIPSLESTIAASGAADRIITTGYVEEESIGAYLAAADVCLCLRWPTALETSASWLHCLAARRATVITDLAHLVDIPASVALRVDLLDEDASIRHAMARLASDASGREALAAAGHAYWAGTHTMAHAADDYRRVIALALETAPPAPTDLPPHVTEDYSEKARAIARHLGVEVDILRPLG